MGHELRAAHPELRGLSSRDGAALGSAGLCHVLPKCCFFRRARARSPPARHFDFARPGAFPLYRHLLFDLSPPKSSFPKYPGERQFQFSLSYEFQRGMRLHAFELSQLEGIADFLVQVAPKFFGLRHKYFHHARVELPAGESLNFLARG